MIKISPFTPLFFNPSSDKFGAESKYVQLFSPSDNILIQVLTSTEYKMEGYLIDKVHGSKKAIEFQSFSLKDDTIVFHYTLTGLLSGYYSVLIGDQECDTFKITDDEQELKKTTLIRYSMRNNKQRNDCVFWNDDTQFYFEFRAPGGFKDDDWTFGVSNEQFEIYNGDIVELFAIESTQKKFTLGNSEGCPVWFAEHLNRILCCSNVSFNGTRFVRKGSSVPEMTQEIVSLKSYIFKVSLQGMVDNIDIDLPEGGETEGGGTGSGVEGYIYLIKLNDTVVPTDRNTYSSLRILAEIDKAVKANNEVLGQKFISKEKDDEAAGLLTFLKGFVSHGLGKALGGLEVGDNGSGITVLPDGTTYAVVDRLYVKIKAIFDELEVKKKTHVGGEQIISPAGMKCIRVEELADTYRCYFKSEEDGVAITNEFTIGQLAISQECNIKAGVSHHVGNRFYWRAVTAVGADFIELSKTDCFADSDIPQSGDDIIGFGHKTDVTRQGAIIQSSVSEASPSIIMYQGIHDFTYVGKEVISFDYDKITGKARMRVYGDAFIGAKDKSSFIEYTEEDGVRIKAKLDVLPGSTGFENMDGMEFGKVNLLRNSGFTGDYNSAKLDEDTPLNESTDLYSQALKFWVATNATVNTDTSSRSGRSVTLATGILTQTLYYKMMPGEKYIISFRAKGSNITVTCGGMEITQQLTASYSKHIFKFESKAETEITIAGTCTLCDLQLECGTVPSEWSMSPLDNNSMESKFEALKYLTDVIREGSTSFIGGLGLLSMILVGNYADGEMKQVTGGLSGVYNDADDPLLWGDGDLEKAIRTVMACKDNPMAFLDMSEEELANYAKIVLTHGGRAILNDVVLRGYVYALGGVFKGKVTQGDGRNVMYEDGSVSFCGGKIRWGKDGNPIIEGKVTTSLDGKRIEIDADANEIVMYDSQDRPVTRIYFVEDENGEVAPGINMYQFNSAGKVVVSTRAVPGMVEINDSDIAGSMGATDYWARLILTPYSIQFMENGKVVKSITSE